MILSAFILAIAAYAGAAALAVWHVRTGAERAPRWAGRLSAAGFAFHSAFLLWWGIASGRLPAYTPFEAVASFLWCAMAGYFVLGRSLRRRALGAFVLPLVAAGGIALLALVSPHTEPARDSTSWWVPVHAASSLLGAADFVVAFAVAVLYLLQRRLLKRKTIGPLMARLPALETLDRANYLAVALGLPVFTFALISGVVLAAETGPGWWANWMVAASLLAWLVFALLLHVRMGAGMRGPKVAYLTILGSLLVAAIVCGIAFASDSLHRLRPEGGPAPVEAPRDAS